MSLNGGDSCQLGLRRIKARVVDRGYIEAERKFFDALHCILMLVMLVIVEERVQKKILLVRFHGGPHPSLLRVAGVTNPDMQYSHSTLLLRDIRHCPLNGMSQQF
jgi:hypothetical protein